MDFATAIREGSKHVEQLFTGEYWRFHNHAPVAWYLSAFEGHPQKIDASRIGYACVVGAALLGTTGQTTLQNPKNIAKALFPRTNISTVCPINTYCTSHENIVDMAIHLNDIHEWTFQQIADWVEYIEN